MKNPKKTKSLPTRRQALKTMGALALPLFVPATALGGGGRPAASDRITMATIGCGGQGTGDMSGFLRFNDVQMLAVCDVVPAHRDRAKGYVDRQYKNGDCQTYNHFRDVLARDDIDAVLIGTPDHWHAIITIEACKAGKDIYCEKPECLTVREGRAMVEAIRRYGRVFSGGSQRVLGDWGDLPRQLWGGALGQIREVYVNCGPPSGDCYLPEQPVPAGLDWDLWLGPAPYRPYHESLIHGGFRPFRDYSGGQMTDWGAHLFGAAMFHTQHHLAGPTEITPPDGRDQRFLTYKFASGLTMYHAPSSRFIYRGTDGEWPGPITNPVRHVDIPGYRGNRGIFGDFIECVKARQKPFRDIEIAHRACSVCHLGNIAYWLNRPLRWDPVREEFIGDAEANRWLDRPKRAPWRL
jgi:hypothetical protein